MPRYIDADALADSMLKPGIWDGLNNQTSALTLVKAAPTADVAPVRRGEWIDEGNGLYSCSLCDILDHREPKHNFCPNCGADMRKERP